MKGEIMPCRGKERIPKGLGEVIENVSGNTGLGKEVFPSMSANEKPQGGAIDSPKYKSGNNETKAENFWR